MDEDHERYSSAEVCDATGLRRTTLEAWILRRYLDLSSGPGTGRERRFTLDEVILIAVTAELTRLGLTVGAAAYAAGMLPRLMVDGHELKLHEEGWLLVLAPSLAPVGVDTTKRPIDLIKPHSLADLRQFIREKHNNPAAVLIADVSAIRKRTVDRLAVAIPKAKGRPRKT